jgi:hypothetical protein
MDTPSAGVLPIRLEDDSLFNEQDPDTSPQPSAPLSTLEAKITKRSTRLATRTSTATLRS